MTKAKDTYQSPDGWTVQVPSIHEVTYTEGGKTLSMEIEGGMEEPGVVDWYVYIPNPCSWREPYELEYIDNEEMVEIQKRIAEALEALEMKYKFLK